MNQLCGIGGHHLNPALRVGAGDFGGDLPGGMRKPGKLSQALGRKGASVA